MPLREHLRELRQRLFKAGIGVAVGSVVGWFLYEPFFNAITRPLNELAHQRHGADAAVIFNQVASPFNLQLRLAVWIGIVVSSPIWLYQLWAFIVPGLTKREKRYAVSFVAAAVPLFLAGIGLAWKVLPNAVNFLTEFTPSGARNYINADDYIGFVTQIMLAFGIAFVVPLLLVGLNLLGILSALSLAKGWRIAVFLCFLFAAIASPSPDAGSMIALAFPMVGLYLIAVGIAWLNDRRRAQRQAAEGWGDLSDDEASSLPEDTSPLPEDTYDTYDEPGVGDRRP
jgi:sec-independent protein translocase protein TatC